MRTEDIRRFGYDQHTGGGLDSRRIFGRVRGRPAAAGGIPRRRPVDIPPGWPGFGCIRWPREWAAPVCRAAKCRSGRKFCSPPGRSIGFPVGSRGRGRAGGFAPLPGTAGSGGALSPGMAELSRIRRVPRRTAVASSFSAPPQKRGVRMAKPSSGSSPLRGERSAPEANIRKSGLLLGLWRTAVASSVQWRPKTFCTVF